MYKKTGSTGICSIDADKCTSDCIDKCTSACKDAGCGDKIKCKNVGYKRMHKTTGSIELVQ